MKKLLFLTLLLCLFILTSCTRYGKVTYITTQFTTSEVNKSVHIIESKDMLLEYASKEGSESWNKVIEKYNDNYFSKKALALVLVSKSSSSYNIKLKNLKIKDGCMNITIKRKAKSNILTMDMAETHIIIELSKEVALSITDYNVVVK